MNSFRMLKSCLVGAALVGLSLAVAPSAANASTTSGGATPHSIGAAVEFQNLNSGGCVDVVRGSLQHGALVTEFSCHNGANQNWLIEPVISAPGFFALRNLNSNMCLDLRTGDVAGVHPGTLIQQWDCFPDNIGSEQWRLQFDNSGGPGALNLVTAVKGLCLDTDPNTGSSVLHIATCSAGSPSQMWREQ